MFPYVALMFFFLFYLIFFKKKKVNQIPGSGLTFLGGITSFFF